VFVNEAIKEVTARVATRKLGKSRKHGDIGIRSSPKKHPVNRENRD
jgi:hypothetical protein